MNKPFTKDQIAKLPIGFTPSTVYLGDEEANGEFKPRFYPNRRQRRLIRKNYKKLLHNKKS